MLCNGFELLAIQLSSKLLDHIAKFLTLFQVYVLFERISIFLLHQNLMSIFHADMDWKLDKNWQSQGLQQVSIVCFGLLSTAGCPFNANHLQNAFGKPVI